MTSRPARPRTLLDFINRPILKGVPPAGNLKRVFTGKSGLNRKKNFGRVMYASETIQNCKNPTGHIDTLRADVCKYQPEWCSSKKLKILKKIHKISYGKLLQEIHVLLRTDNYFRCEARILFWQLLDRLFGV